ncbi:MAG TPA: hypothetical protein VFZ17_08810, partial [Acidimicrobiia bacterium]|nr:hypothetical protein [Acidimicrobiia bacterium]
MATTGNDPFELLSRALDGYLTTHLLAVVTQLGVAEHLADGPLDAVELATLVGADPDRLRRVLRGLVVEAILAEDEHGRFSLTPAGELLPSVTG